MSRTFTRRSLLSTTARGLPALAFGSSLLSTTANAIAAPKARFTAPPKGKIYGPAGEAAVKGDVALPNELRAAAMLVQQKARHAVTTALANPNKAFKHRLAKASARFVGSLSSKRIARAKARATTLLSATEPKRKAAFGPYAVLGVADYQLSAKPDLELRRKLEVVQTSAWEVTHVKGMFKQKKVKPKNEPKYAKLEFHLNTVKCVEETDEVGADEILLGGELIKPDGSVAKLSSFKVSDDFDQGEVKYYDDAMCIGLDGGAEEFFRNYGMCNGTPSDPYRGRVLASSGLSGPWPGTWGLVLLMVEEDHGGFGALLQDLYGAIKAELEEALKGLGTAVGSAIGGAIGAVIGQVVAWVLGELIEWLVGLFDNRDDPIAAKSWILTLDNATRAYIDEVCAGGLESPANTQASQMKELVFKGDGGKYVTRMHWRALA